MKEGSSFKIYDKVSWHYPEGKDCPSIEAAKRHINFAMRFLEAHDLLSEDGKDLFSGGKVDDDFALTSDVVTSDGEALLSKGYRKWLGQISYQGRLSAELFENILNGIRKSKKESNMAEKPTKRKKQEKIKKEDSSEPSPFIYDSVEFHWPMGKSAGCKSLDDAKNHLNVLMRWLSKHGLLTAKSKSAATGKGVPDDFTLTSDMLTDRGNDLMMAAYHRWLKSVRYGKEPDTKILDRALADL